MPRTKHALIFVLILIGLMIVFALSGDKSDGSQSARVVSPLNLFVTETPTMTVEDSSVVADKKSIRDAFLAKLGSVKNTAALVQNSETDNMNAEEIVPETEVVSETPVSTPIPLGEFDWSLWLARVPEFTEKQLAYETTLNEFKEQLKSAELEKSVLMTEGLSDAASTTPRAIIAQNGVECLTAQIEAETKVVAELQGIETAPVGLLYKVLIDEIQAQQESGAVTELYRQILVAEAKNILLLSSYAQTAKSCGQFYNEFMLQASGV